MWEDVSNIMSAGVWGARGANMFLDMLAVLTGVKFVSKIANSVLTEAG